MTKRQWPLIRIVCFTMPNLDGKYLTEMEYRALYQLAPNIRAAFDGLDEALTEVRGAIEERIEEARKASTSSVQ